LHDVDLARIETGLAQVRTGLEKIAAKGKISAADVERITSAIRPAPELGIVLADVALIIEAVPEDMSLKAKILSECLAHAPHDALFASNTSSLSITELGARVGAPDRTIGMHFFNPPPVMELLEIVRGVGTSDKTIERARSIAAAIGKTSILVNDAPGFATSRLGVVLGAEAMRMLETGVASAADIDRAMELGYRHPMGPLKLPDLVG